MRVLLPSSALDVTEECPSHISCLVYDIQLSVGGGPERIMRGVKCHHVWSEEYH